MRGLLGAALLTALLLAGCGTGALRDHEMWFAVSNQTTIPVDVVVNGVPVGAVAAHDLANFVAFDLPPLPWQVTAHSPSGRVLLTLLVRSGSVSMQPDRQVGIGARVDLSCGRLDMYAGPPLLGPMPGPGRPGDCD